MRIGFLGMGKLGTPVAVCLSDTFKVIGYDQNANLCTHRTYEHKEAGLHATDNFQMYFDRACNLQGRSTGLMFAQNMDDMVRHSDVIFVAVQTPHQPKYEGVAPLTSERDDFDYTYLIQACKELSERVRPEQTVAIISTCLPGTIRKHILPLLKDKCEVVYHPLFIAMGTVMQDYCHPEFVLLGGTVKGITVMKRLYEQFYYSYNSSPPPILEMSIESAELGKVSYNTYITTKVCLANTIMEIAHKTPNCNCDDVARLLCCSNKRILGQRYMRGGGSDGGGCHPRDNIAMSWLANKLEMKTNMFDSIMRIRQNQAMWLVELLCLHGGGLPKVILGKAFKEETNITTGSGAVLCANLLKELGHTITHYDPHTDNFKMEVSGINAYLIGTKHEIFKKWQFVKGSVVIDPFRYIPKQEGVNVIHVGVGPKEN